MTIDKSSREYLKRSAPAPVTNVPDKELTTRTALRRKLITTVKNMRWRAFRKYHRVRPDLSMKKRLVFMNAVLAR